LAELTGTVLDIQRLSTEDGPGLRTTVFMKGCGLACTWCHNPESIRFKRQVQWIEVGRCIGCGLCVEACPADGLRLTETGIAIDRDLCEACAACVDVCPTNAMEVKGEYRSPEGLVREVIKDRAFWGKDGGVTFSGGEALMQAEFVVECLKRLRAAGVHTAVDTAGLVPEKAMEGALENADLILYDLKLFDGALHERFTGARNDVVLKHARMAAEYRRAHGAPEIRIRTPIIPGVTDTEENISAIGRFIATYMNDEIFEWELCSFNNLCASKYARLGMKWDFDGVPLMRAQRMEALTEAAKKSGPDPEKILWTGSTRTETQ
jgi:pyruvate formate lyase activating enzyme